MNQDYPRYLQAGVEYDLLVGGEFYHILEASDTVYVALDNGDWKKRAQGLGEKSNFSTMRIKSLVAQAVIITVGYGELIDTRASVDVTVSATVTPSDILTPQTDVSLPAGPGPATLICAANANRKSLMLKGSVSNDPSVIVRIGNSGVAADKGIEMTAGEGITIETEAAVYGYNTDSSNAFTVTIIENTITP